MKRLDITEVAPNCGNRAYRQRQRAARGEAIALQWRHARWTTFAATLGDGQAADIWMRRAKLAAYRLLPPLPLP